MQTAQFDYYRPSTLEEAISLLGSVDGARPLAGGHSLLPVMKRRLSSPAALVDIGRLPNMDKVFVDRGSNIRIGALATHAAVAASGFGVLADTAAMIGDDQVRNRGTIGGSVAHADPAADYPTVLVALGASITVQGADGTRTIAADEFFVDLFETALQPGELVTEITVPELSGGAAYVKHRHPASSYAVVGVAAVVSGPGSGHMVVGGATPTPVKVDGIDPDAIPGAISDPIGDVYASGEYRVHLATVLAKRALALAS